MKTLDRKVIRDALRLAPQLVAVTLVMACGVAVLVMSWSMLRSLADAQRAWYERAQFADVFLHLRRAPDVVGRRLASISGVSRLETRIVKDVTIDPPESGPRRTPAVGRLITLPRGAAQDHDGLNRVHLLRGRLPDPTRPSEALVGEGFAAAHGLAPGDRVFAVLNGRRTRLDLVGIATSPEYVYTIGPGGFFPDDRSFGIFWMGRDGLAAAFDLQDAFNDVVATVAPGVPVRDVCRDLDAALDRYGGLGAMGREFQTSHRYLTNELRELRNMGRVAPLVFLAVSAILMHLVISRLIGGQREQIAMLAAFGLTPREIGGHFVKIALVVLACGAVVGTALGWWLGIGLASMYSRFFRFPSLQFHPDPAAIAWSLAVAAAAALAGVLHAVLRAVRIRPAAAMQPESPARYRASLPERLGIAAWLSPTTRMVLRHLERRSAASGLSILGLALGTAVMVLGLFVGDAVQDLADFEFTLVQRYDRAVTFADARGRDVVAACTRLPGVRAAEPIRGVMATLRHGPGERRQEIIALAEGGELLRIVDRHGRVREPPRRGVVLSRRLAELLGVQPGGEVEADILEGRRPRIRWIVAGVVDDMVGTSAWVHAETLRAALHEGPTVSGVLLAVDSSRTADLDGALADSPRVAGFVARDLQRRTFDDTIARTLLRMRTVNAVFAVVIACGVVATTAWQSVVERSRELASLRVLGFTRSEVAAILLSEQAILTLAALPPGLLLGAAFVHVTTWGYDTELFRIPAVVHPRTCAVAAATVIGAALAAALTTRGLLDRLDLVGVLKARD